MANLTITGTQRNRPNLGSSAYGNTWRENNVVTVSAALATTDTVVLMDVPAGIQVDTLRFYNGDLDTDGTPALVAKIGYRTALPGSATAAVLDAFGSSLTTFQAATTTWQELTFAPVTFNEPMQIVLTPTTAADALSTAASITVQVGGIVRGIA